MKISFLKLAFSKIFYTSLFFILLSQFSFAQTIDVKGNVNITVKGTSNLHDWDVKSTTGVCEAKYTVNAKKELDAFKYLKFTVDGNSLKSTHGNSMDKNTRAALKTSTYPNITFTGTSATVEHVSANNYKVSCSGDLLVAGVTKSVRISATLVLQPDNSLTGNGQYTFDMTTFKIDPPTALFGTIKTGKEVTVVYTFNLK